jgi:hypothetical protein
VTSVTGTSVAVTDFCSRSVQFHQALTCCPVEGNRLYQLNGALFNPCELRSVTYAIGAKRALCDTHRARWRKGLPEPALDFTGA